MKFTSRSIERDIKRLLVAIISRVRLRRLENGLFLFPGRETSNNFFIFIIKSGVQANAARVVIGAAREQVPGSGYEYIEHLTRTLCVWTREQCCVRKQVSMFGMTTNTIRYTFSFLTK